MSENLKKDLVAVLAKHGLERIPVELHAELIQAPVLDPGKNASYIKEIITDKNAYDEKILVQVGEALKTFKAIEIPKNIRK
jgi:hypothetical protein